MQLPYIASLKILGSVPRCAKHKRIRAIWAANCQPQDFESIASTWCTGSQTTVSHSTVSNPHGQETFVHKPPPSPPSMQLRQKAMRASRSTFQVISSHELPTAMQKPDTLHPSDSDFLQIPQMHCCIPRSSCSYVWGSFALFSFSFGFRHARSRHGSQKVR